MFLYCRYQLLETVLCRKTVANMPSFYILNANFGASFEAENFNFALHLKVDKLEVMVHYTVLCQCEDEILYFFLRQEVSV